MAGRITSKELAETISMTKHDEDLQKVSPQVARALRSYRVEDSRMPKQLQLGELERPQPRDGTKKRLRDLVEKDVQAVKLGRAWYV